VTTKAELVEAMARAMCAAQGLDWKDQFSIYSSNGDPLAHEAYMHDADAALSALRQWLAYEGLAIVPREATPHMCTHASLVEVDDIELTPSEYRAAWRAMIAAAPDTLKGD